MFSLKRWLLTALFIVGAVVSRAEQFQQLVIASKSGTVTSYRLDESPRVTFSGDNLVLETISTVIEIPVTQIDKIYYEVAEASGINDVNSDSGVSFEVIDRQLIISSNLNTNVTVYGIDGIQWVSRSVSAGETASISLANLTDGIYLVKIGSTTHKIVIR